METLKKMLSEELTDSEFLQLAQIIWAECTELASTELLEAPSFSQFSSDLMLLEKTVVPQPCQLKSYISVGELRKRMIWNYQKTIEILGPSGGKIPEALQPSIDGLQEMPPESHSVTDAFPKQLQHLVLLLLLLFTGGVQYAAAAGSGTSNDPYTGDIGIVKLGSNWGYFKNVTSGSIEVTGRVILYFEGINTLNCSYRGSDAVWLPAITANDKNIPASGDAKYYAEAIIKSSDVNNPAIVKVKPYKSGDGTIIVGGIGGQASHTKARTYPMAKVTIQGNIYVEAYDAAKPEVKGVCGGYNDGSSKGNGALYLEDGPTVCLNKMENPSIIYFPTYVYTSTYAFVSDPTNSGGSPTYIDDAAGGGNTTIIKPRRVDSERYTPKLEDNKFYSTNISTGVQKGYVYKSNLMTNFALYTKTDLGVDYKLINDIPFSCLRTAGVWFDFYECHMGEVSDAKKKQWGSETYRSISGSSNTDLYLNVNNYPSKGTLKAEADITLSRDTNAMYREQAYCEFATANEGFTLDASNHAITLYGLNFKSGKLFIKGGVKLSTSEPLCVLDKPVLSDATTSVYYCDAKLSNNGKVTSVKYKIGNTTYTCENYSQSKDSLFLWLPQAALVLQVSTEVGVTYTNSLTISNIHYQHIELYPTEFDLSSGSAQVTAASAPASQSVAYAGNNYASPVDQGLVFYNSSSAASGNTLTVTGGSRVHLTLKDIQYSGMGTWLSVSGNKTEAMIDLVGTNIGTASNDATVRVGTGSTLSLRGQGKLEASANNVSYSDIANEGTIRLTGEITLKSVNSRFLPNVQVDESGKQTVQVYLGTQKRYLSFIDETKSGTISDIQLVADGSAYTGNVFHDAIGNKTWLWALETPASLLFKGKKGVNSPNTYINDVTQRFLEHVSEISFDQVAASVTTGSSRKPYLSLADALQDASAGQTVQVESNYEMKSAEKAVCKKLSEKELLTLRLPENTTLTGMEGSTLSSGQGILVITGGSGSDLAGQFALGGAVYTELPLSAVRMVYDETAVFRTWVSGFPENVADRLYYLNGRKARYDRAAKKACFWLPLESGSVIVADELTNTRENMAQISITVTNNHNNAATVIPYLDIANGNISIENNGTAQATYGSKPYRMEAVLPAVVLGSTTTYHLTVKGTGATELIFDNLSILPDNKDEAVHIASPVTITLSGVSRLKGGYNNPTTYPAIAVASNGSLTIQTGKEGTGVLNLNGGYMMNTAGSPAIHTEGPMTIKSGTVIARHGAYGTTEKEDILGNGSIQIRGGSVDARFEQRPVNAASNAVYRVAVTTGLTGEQRYSCKYDGCEPSTGFDAVTDASGKVYCWMEKRDRSVFPKYKVTLTHPVSFKTTDVEVVEVKDNDFNVAPIVLELIDNNKPVSANNPKYFGNLSDAFGAMEAGADGNTPNSYTLNLMTRIENLSTLQTVPANTNLVFDLGSYEITALSGSNVSFNAASTGAYLQITGKGNIKNIFSLEGDVFITGLVPLTDATIEIGGKSVFRTLVKNLPVAAGNSYTYSYGSQQNIPFMLHDGLACLWLTDNGDLTELRFTVTNNSGSSTEYTSGSITTVTQRTEAIPANPVGVVARVTYDKGTQNQAFNTLKEALAEARKANLTGNYKDVEVTLLTSVSISGGSLKAEGGFVFNLDGKSLLSASGSHLTIAPGADIEVKDDSKGVKGTLSADILLESADAFLSVPSSINMTGNVKRRDVNLWRTLVNMNYQPETVKEVSFEGKNYPVIGGYGSRELCIWLETSNDMAKKYSFTVDGRVVEVTNRTVSANHANDMTLGGYDYTAQIGSQGYTSLKDAFTDADYKMPVNLLKTTQLTEALTVAKTMTLQLGKYGIDSAAVVANVRQLTIDTGAKLTVASMTGTGRLKTPLVLKGMGQLFIGQTLAGEHIGEVSRDGNRVYRLLVTNLPSGIPNGSYEYTFSDETNSTQTGSFMAIDGVACLWLKACPSGGRLTFTIAGKDDAGTDNVVINPDHYNIETYGVSDVAQIKNGGKYRSLHEAFEFGAGKTIVLLKNTALTQRISVNGSVTLETGKYSITASSGVEGFVVGKESNLRITGTGSVTAGFSIEEAATTSGYSNCNLQADKEVVLTGNVKVGSRALQRVNVEGLPASELLDFQYGDGEADKNYSGQVITTPSGQLCLWMNVSTTTQNFFVDNRATGKSWMATSVVITATHANPVMVASVGAVATLGPDKTPFNTLDAAFDAAADGDVIELRKSVDNLTTRHAIASGTVTLDLGKNQLKSNGASFNADGGQIIMKDGQLSGYMTLTGNVFADGDVLLSGMQVTAENKTVWRTLITLPKGTDKIRYKFGDTREIVSTNILDGTTEARACLWLTSSSSFQTLTVLTGKQEFVLNGVTIASTHGNELDITSGNDPVAETNGKVFASLASALSEGITARTPVLLKKNLTLSSVQTITDDLTLDLGGFSITSGNGGFSVAEGKKLTLQQGMLLGTMRLNGKGSVFAGNTIRIAGIVLNAENKEVYRTQVKVGPAALIPGRCLWLETAELEYDVAFSETGAAYQVAIPAGLSNHNTVLTAYPHIQLAGAVTWKANYAGTNLELMSDARLTIPSGTGGDIHRLTLHDGARILFADNGSQIRATEGIRYVRSFPADVWESVALPFSAIRITTVDDKGTAYPIGPAYGAGTAGHFWLRTIDINGKLQTVNNAEMTANVSYLMAVPTELSEAVTFISGPNQLLRRSKEMAVKPTSGFASYANGTLDEVSVDEPCYLLATGGTTYVRHTTALIPPFRGYLLADATTTTITPELRLGTATGNEPVAEPSAGNLRIYTLPGRVVVETQQVTQVRIYTVTGYCVRALRVPGGRTEIPLDRNVYIVNNTKVWVK